MDLTRTQVWLADGPAMARLAATPLRSAEDRARLRGIRSPRARLRFTAGRALATRLLDRAGLPASTRIVPDERGCPRLDPPAGLAVSISHTESWAAAAIVEGDRCGIDVQDRLDPSRFTAAILGAVLPGDWARRFTEHADPAAELTRLWAILEAALKWRGTGFSAPLTELRFDRRGDGARVAERSGGTSTRIDVSTLPGGAMLGASADLRHPRVSLVSVDDEVGDTGPAGLPDPRTSHRITPLLSSTKG